MSFRSCLRPETAPLARQQLKGKKGKATDTGPCHVLFYGDKWYGLFSCMIEFSSIAIILLPQRGERQHMPQEPCFGLLETRW